MVYLCKYIPNFSNHTIIMPKILGTTYWKTIALCVVIFIVSTVNVTTVPDVAKFPHCDKVIHFLMYAVLGFVACTESLQDKLYRLKFKYWLWFVFAVLVLFGGLIEILQGAFFKPRTAEFLDWIADIAGLGVGFWVGKIFSKAPQPPKG